MSRVLVTGASGFLGRRLVPALLAAGHSVAAAVRRPEALDHTGVQVVPLKLTDRKTFTALPREVDTIVHAAAERLDLRSDWMSIARLVRVNTLGTLHLLEYAEACGISRVVYCSTLSVYALPQPVPIREDGLTYPVQAQDSFYGISKLGGELLCTRFQREGRLACLCLRLGRIYGPEENPKSLLSGWAREACQGREIVVYGDGERSLDFIYIDDAVRGIVAAVGSDWVGGPLNLASGVETTWRALAETLVDVFSPPERRAPVRYIPQGNQMRCFLDISQAKRMLDFVPRYSLKDGLLAWRDAKVVPPARPIGEAPLAYHSAASRKRVS